MQRPLIEIVEEVRNRKQRRGQNRLFDIQQGAQLAGIFESLSLFVFSRRGNSLAASGSRGQCLLHAQMLIHFLSQYDVYPTWVIGVRVMPWAAHSWVQEGSAYFDDPGLACDYTPIYAV
jgi:Transglutaminase-like superfamily